MVSPEPSHIEPSSLVLYPVRVPDHDAILKKLRAICRALPATSETVTFGHPTFQVKAKTFAVLEVYKGELCVVFKAELPVQQALIQSQRFFTAPYIGKHGWVSLRVGGRLDWKEIEDLVSESWRLVAPKSVATSDRNARTSDEVPARASKKQAALKKNVRPARAPRKRV